MKIHFICRGNVLRSLIAETYLKSLEIDGVETISSGVLVDQATEQEAVFFASTLKLLERREIKSFAKEASSMLTQARLNDSDINIFMNQVVIEEASVITTMPENIINWDITDIGEGSRVVKADNRNELEELVFAEIIQKVDLLVAELGLTPSA